MERLKSLVPEELKQTVGKSTPHDLPSSSSALLSFLLHSDLFHHLIRDLAADPKGALCGKNKDLALESKRQGNKCFFSGEYAAALDHYSQALRVAPIDVDDMDKNLVATLYVNRASVLHKMGLLAECVRDCDRALQISSSYAKAWFRRGKANASMGNYEDAVRDYHVAKNVELSSSGRKQIENELNIILDQHKRPDSKIVHDEDESDIFDELQQIELQCVTTPDKGRAMASVTDLPPSSLVHTEEPHAVIILKHCRETHCHYCLNELPVDNVPCTSCSAPLYCSQRCRTQAGGQIFLDYRKNQDIHANLSENIKNYIAEITLGSYVNPDTEHSPEHKHECQGAHWPVVLPSEIVLAGRIVTRSIAERGGCMNGGSSFMGELKLSHNFSQMPPESKLELLIYSVILLSCLQNSYSFRLPVDGITVSQIVIVISQIRLNSISIVRLKSSYAPGLLEQSGKFYSGGSLTSDMEQVKVGQAIYTAGSLFNHSCKPNVHAYFLSRTLFIRTTEFVSTGCHLEFSYGPQVGQWDCKDRRKFLEDEYSFRCLCSGCSMVNLSDLVLNAFRCGNPNCSGIVLDSSTFNCEQQKIKDFLSTNKISSLEPYLQVNSFLHIEHGKCLKCGSYRDMESSRAASDEAWIHFRRVEEAIISESVSNTTLSDALRSLDLLRSTLHAYNRRVAEAEDKLARAFCLIREFQPAVDHCEASIKILKKLYGPNHIVIGNELLKLSSIQLSLDDQAAVDSINRLNDIFMCYYGSHANVMFSFLKSLSRGDRHRPVQHDLTKLCLVQTIY